MTDRVDVVVVGAGPAGSTCAVLLARLGYEVVLLDRAHFPRAKACAEYLSPGVIESLGRLGLSATVESDASVPVPGMDIVGAGGEHLRLGYVRDGRPEHARTMPRREFDAELLSAARNSGVTVREGHHVRRLKVEEGTVTGVAGNDGETEFAVHAPLTVIADGNRSPLAASLGLARQPRWPRRLGLVAHFQGTPALDAGYGQMHVGRDGYCGVAPLAGGMINVAAVVREDSVRLSPRAASTFLDEWIVRSPQLAHTLSGCVRATPARGVAPVGSRSRRAWWPGALLVGDAASFFDPFTGEGIHNAVRGAELVAGVAHDALSRRDYSASTLRRYDALRAATFRRKSMVTALVQLFVQYPALMSYALPRLERRAFPTQTLGLVLGDLTDASAFLRPGMLWSALRP